jgi:hypothetical protein
MRVPDPFKKCVCFLCIRQVQNGPELYRYGGTAFFVAVQLGDLQFHAMTTRTKKMTRKRTMRRKKSRFGGLLSVAARRRTGVD